MQPIRLVSAAGQVAAYLRGEVERGLLGEKMPGVGWLAAALGVNRKTVEAALYLLEREGLLLGQGVGRKRLIVPPDGKTARPMRLGILIYESADHHLGHLVEIQHRLMAAGHTVIFPAKSLTELGMDVARVSRLVNKTEVDAWVVICGSREVLQWFAAQPLPAFALMGCRSRVAIAAAGPDMFEPFVAATRQLIALGHRRIVSICRSERRKPIPGQCELAFLKELAAHGIPTGDYNLPDWEEGIDGLHACLKSLFQVTQPTALIFDDVPIFVAAQQFLAGRGLRVPGDVSLIVKDANRCFDWCLPAITQLWWDTRPVVRRVVRWAANVSRGKQDLRQTLTPAKFVLGGTIGPVADSKRPAGYAGKAGR